MKNIMIQKFYDRLESFLIAFFNRLDKPALQNRILLGQILSQQVRKTTSVNRLSEVEFKIFSQHREDGIIQYLIHHVPISHKTFIEFGVEDYRESNTRFLLMNDNWKGLIMDSQRKYISRIQSYDLYWQHDLKAVQAFITKDNINDLCREHGFIGEIGLLSIDIDGNDYWIWERITTDFLSPSIVILEYNSILGNRLAITIPYTENFVRRKAKTRFCFSPLSLIQYHI